MRDFPAHGATFLLAHRLGGFDSRGGDPRGIRIDQGRLEIATTPTYRPAWPRGGARKLVRRRCATHSLKTPRTPMNSARSRPCCSPTTLGWRCSASHLAFFSVFPSCCSWCLPGLCSAHSGRSSPTGDSPWSFGRGSCPTASRSCLPIVLCAGAGFVIAKAIVFPHRQDAPYPTPRPRPSGRHVGDGRGGHAVPCGHHRRSLSAAGEQHGDSLLARGNHGCVVVVLLCLCWKKGAVGR